MIVTFGEMLMRLSPPGYERFAQARQYDCWFGGAEGNTAVLLAQLGRAARPVTVLPANPIGCACRAELMRFGVDTTQIRMDESPEARMGLYFCEQGGSQRPSRVIYDRAGSAFARARHNDFHWDEILDGADWFHFTGITPALGPELAAAALDGCRTAKRQGMRVSCDLNYRASLWSREQARAIMPSYLEYTDLLFANAGSIFDTLGFGGRENIPEATLDAAKAVRAQYRIPNIALTMRESLSASQNAWSAMLLDPDGREFWSKRYVIDIIDRIGGGDSFAAGMIDAVCENRGGQYAVEFAAAASCLKHTIPGDFNLVTREEIRQLMDSDTMCIER